MEGFPFNQTFQSSSASRSKERTTGHLTPFGHSMASLPDLFIT